MCSRDDLLQQRSAVFCTLDRIHFGKKENAKQSERALLNGTWRERTQNVPLHTRFKIFPILQTNLFLSSDTWKSDQYDTTFFLSPSSPSNVRHIQVSHIPCCLRTNARRSCAPPFYRKTLLSPPLPRENFGSVTQHPPPLGLFCPFFHVSVQSEIDFIIGRRKSCVRFPSFTSGRKRESSFLISEIK